MFIPWRVVEVRALSDYKLWLRFADGLTGEVLMRDQIFREDAGVFAWVRDPEEFAKVSIDGDFGHVEWACGLDIAPDASHDEIQKHGIQILR